MIVNFTSHGSCTLRPYDRIVSVLLHCKSAFLMIANFQIKDRIFTENDRKLFANDGLVSANDHLVSTNDCIVSVKILYLSHNRLVKQDRTYHDRTFQIVL